MKKTFFKHLMITFCIIIASAFGAIFNVYGDIMIPNNEDTKNFSKSLEDVEFEGMTYNGNNNVVADTEDPQIHVDLEQEIGYINVIISTIDSDEETSITIYLPSEYGYSENNTIVRKARCGDNIFIFDQPISEKVRIDIGSESGLIAEIDGFEYGIKPGFVFNYWIVFFVFTFFGIIAYIFILNRKRCLQYITENSKEILWILAFFCWFLLWSVVLPYNAGPDEFMRYDVVEYLYEYRVLPRGDDPILCTGNLWGISYAFSPYLPYLIATLFMQIASVFTALSELGLLHVARLVSVLSSTVTIVFLFKISNKLNFKHRFFLPIVVGLLPQFTFISAYVNNDAFAIMTTSIIVYAWIVGIKTYWNRESCVCLALGMAFCVASYYNCYGYLLVSFFVFVCSYIYWAYKEKNTKRIVEMFQKGFGFVFVVVAISGWWFIRNYIIYDGDFMGSNASTAAAIKYSIPELSPLNKKSLYEQGVTLSDMLFEREWIETTAKSFIACFGYMQIYLVDSAYLIWRSIIALGLIGKCVSKVKNVKASVKCEVESKYMDIAYACSIVIVLVLSIIYSYTSDFQPQGRYILPIVVPLGIWLAQGWHHIEDILKQKIIVRIITAFIIFCNIYALMFEMIPFYYWDMLL